MAEHIITGIDVGTYHVKVAIARLPKNGGERAIPEIIGTGFAESRGLIDRTKKGFGVPIGTWLRGPLKVWGEELLSEENIKASGIFTPEYIRELWTEHQSGKRDHRKRLWNILVFLEWKKRFL